MDLYEACENGNEERVVELLLLTGAGAGGARTQPGFLSGFGARLGAVAAADGSDEPALVPAEAPAAMLQTRGTAGRTPLLAACMGVQLGVVRLLLGEPCVVRFTGRSKEEARALLAPLALALARRHQRSRIAGASARDLEGSRRLFEVSLTAEGRKERVPVATVQLPPDRVVAPRDLLQSRVHVDAFGNTPLQCVSCFGCGSTEQHVDDCLEITRLLLARGDQPNVPKRASKWTPLHWSAFNGCHEQAAVLLRPEAHVGATVARTQRAIPLMVNAAEQFPADVAGRRGLALMDEMRRLRGGGDSAYARWRLRLDHAGVLRLFAREFVAHAAKLQRYVAEMNARAPAALLRAQTPRFSPADALRYGQHLLYWCACLGLLDELRALLQLRLRLPRRTRAAGESPEQEQGAALQPLYACSCEENKHQSALHAAAALGRADVVALLLREVVAAQRRAAGPERVAAPLREAAARLDVVALARSGWTNQRGETPLFLAALFLRHEAVAALLRALSPASVAWELSVSTVEGALLRHVADAATRQALGLGGGPHGLVHGEYVLLFDGDRHKAFKESLVETLREDSAAAPPLVVTRAGSRAAPASRWPWPWSWPWRGSYSSSSSSSSSRRGRRTDYLVVGATGEVLARHAEALQLQVRHRGSSARSTFSAAAAARFEPLRSLQRQQLVLDIIQRNVDLRGHLRRGDLAAAFPLHDAAGCQGVLRQWVRSDARARVFQPLRAGSLRQFLFERRAHQYEMLWPLLTYFGEKHAAYYAFVAFYTSWLLLAAAPGALCQLLWLAAGAERARGLSPLFALAVALWATLLVERWKRKRSELQRTFGRARRGRAEADPDFYGDFHVETLARPVVELAFPRAARRARVCCGLPLLLALAACAVAVFVGVRTRYVPERLAAQALPASLPLSRLAPDLAPLLNAACMLALDHVYTRVARALTRWENHRTVWQHESMLAAKLFCFKFLNAFISLFWVAFVDRDAATLRKQLVVVMGVRQLWYVAVRNVLPLVRVRRRWRAAGFRFRRPPSSPDADADADADGELEWYNAELPPELARNPERGDVPPMVLVQELMQPPDFLMDKQMEIILQFGYVTMFVAVLPAAPLLAMFSNVAAMRLDVLSATQAKQRPPFESETEVQTFMSILEFMSFAAVAVNCGVLFFTVADDFDSLLQLLWPGEWTDAEGFYVYKLWVLLLVEHVVLGAKAILSLAIDDSAAWVRDDDGRSDEDAKRRPLQESATDGSRLDEHDGSTQATSVHPASGRHERDAQTPSATAEAMVDELLDQVVQDGSASLSAISLASLERLNRIVVGRLAVAVAERDRALAREREVGEKLDQAMHKLASKPPHAHDASTSSAEPQRSEVRVGSVHLRFGSGTVSTSDGLATDASATATPVSLLRQCFFCFALSDVVTASAKRCLSCRVFLCLSCDATLHLDDLGVAEPTHFRVNVPVSGELEARRGVEIAPLVLSSPLYATLKKQIDAFVASDGGIHRQVSRPTTLDAGEILRRCSARVSVTVRFLRNCERRRALSVTTSDAAPYLSCASSEAS